MRNKEDKTFTKIMGGAGFGFGATVGLMSPFMFFPGPYRPAHSNRGVMLLSLGTSVVGTTLGASTGYTIDRTIGFFKPSEQDLRKTANNNDTPHVDGNNPFQ